MWIEKNGPVYRIRDSIGGRKVTLKTGWASKTAAKAAMRQMQADALRGDSLVPRGGEITLDSWLDAWWPSYVVSLKPSSAHSEGGRVKNHIRPLLGHLQLDDLCTDPLVVQRWISQLLAGERDPADRTKWRRKPLAVKSVRNCHGLLHKILQSAVMQKLVRANPCSLTSLPKRVHREMRFLTDPEIERLVRHTPEHWRPLVLLLVATGLRWGEAVGLRVKCVDLLATPAPRLMVLETLQELSGTGEIVFGPPKSEKSRRTVTFTRGVAAGLTGLVVGKEREELVFLTALGRPVRTRNFRRIWLGIIKAAGLPGLRIHDLRHTHAATLISAGSPLTAVQRRLGHSSIAVTSDLYGHLRQEAHDGVLAIVEASLGGIDLEKMTAEVRAELVGVQ